MGYEKIRQITNNIVEKQQNIEDIEQKIINLKDTRRILKQQIKEMEEKINKSILENDEPNSNVIQDIKNLLEIIKEQEKQRKEAKQEIKNYKENKKIIKHELKQDRKSRNSVIDER